MDYTGGKLFENWKSGGLGVGDMKQVVNNLPNGKYFLKMVAFTRLNTDADYIYIKTASDEKTSFLPTAESPQISVTDPIEVTDGTVEIGLHIGSGSDWAALGMVELLAYEVAAEERAIATGKFGTVCLPYDATVEGAKIYSAALNDAQTAVVLTEVAGGNVEAGVPYIYEAEADAQTFTWTGATDLVAEGNADGVLTGVLKAGTVPVGSYVMQTQNGEQKFYKVGEGTEYNATLYRAYLTKPATEAKGVLDILFEGNDATGIDGVEVVDTENAEIYDLNGSKLNGLRKGINIVNGVKVLVK